MNAHRWIQYFENHRPPPRRRSTMTGTRPAPDIWRPDITALAASLAIFQLGESGGGTRLRRYAEP